MKFNYDAIVKKPKPASKRNIYSFLISEWGVTSLYLVKEDSAILTLWLVWTSLPLTEALLLVLLVGCQGAQQEQVNEMKLSILWLFSRKV